MSQKVVYIIVLKMVHIGSLLLIEILEDALLNVLMAFSGWIQLKDVSQDARPMNMRILLFVYVFSIAQFARIITKQAMENVSSNAQ